MCCSSKVQLFKTTPRTAKFKAQDINRKLQPQQHKAPLQRIGHGRPPVNDEDETEVKMLVPNPCNALKVHGPSLPVAVAATGVLKVNKKDPADHKMSLAIWRSC